ncbi:Transmembrane_domain-containing protein [Hexamita inflata]|uniref:Transmembrane_domain-containing protein n=2 Tax=Hexamita inflata TaxID=28002 RepID=A0ABP1HTH5_9EUKA
MGYEQCLKACPKQVCDVIPSCYKKSRYSQPMLISFTFIEFIIALFQIVLFCMYLINGRRNKQAKQHLKIFVTSFFALTTRSIWYFMSQYYYHADLPVISEQVLNGISLTCIYLQQSFYVQTWLRVVLMLSHMKGEKYVKIFFPILDSSIALTCIVILSLRMSHGKEKDDGYYSTFTLVVAGFNIGIGLIFIIMGTIIFFKLKQYYSFCSKAVQSFVIVAVLFLCITFMRFITLIWKDITGEFMQQNQFGVLAYFLPDFISTFIINFMQVTIYYSTIHQKKKKYLGMQEQSEELDELVSEKVVPI